MQLLLKLFSGLLISALLLLTQFAYADDENSAIKILMCSQEGKTIEVAEDDLDAQLAEGAILGACEEDTTVDETGNPTTTADDDTITTPVDDDDATNDDDDNDSDSGSDADSGDDATADDDDDADSSDDSTDGTDTTDETGTPSTTDDDSDGGDNIININIDINLLDAEALAALDLDIFLAFGFNDLTLLSPEAISGISAKQFKKLPLSALIALSPAQFAALDMKIIKELKAEQIAVLSVDVIATLTPEQLEEIKYKEVVGFSAEQIAVLQPATVAAFSKKQIGKLSYEAVQGFSLVQFESISVKALEGFTAKNIGALDQEIVAAMGLDILQVVDKKEVEKISETDLTWLLFNMNLVNFSVEQITQVIVLPQGWEIDKKGKIKIKGKKGKKLKIKLPKFKFKKPKEKKYEIVMPSLPSLKVNLNIGGQSDDDTQTTFIQNINQTLINLNFADFSMTQNDDGIIWVEGSGQSKGTKLSLIVDEDSFEQVEEGTPASVSIDSKGHYVVITETGYKCKLLPAPKNTEKLGALLAGGKISINKRGTTTLFVPSLNQTVVGVFDPLVYTVPVGTPSGISIKGLAGRDERIEIVYEDATMQILRPSVLSQDALILARNTLPDFNLYGKYKFRSNGHVHFIYGKRLMRLIPSFNINVNFTVKQVNPIINILNGERFLVSEAGESQKFYIEDIGDAEEFEDDEDDDEDDDD